MDDEEILDPEVELARLNEERRLMEQLQEGKGWEHLVKIIAKDVLLSQQARDNQFLTTNFGENRLDGIQSLVYEGYVKGLHAGLRRATEIPQRIVANNRDHARLLEQKIALNKEKENGSSTNDSRSEWTDGYDGAGSDEPPIGEHLAP